MFHVLVASQPIRTGWLSGTAFSTVTHGTLIAAALMSTGRAPSAVARTPETVAVRVTYVRPPTPDLSLARRASDPSGDAAAAAASPPPLPPLPPMQDLITVADAIDQALGGQPAAAEPDLNPMMAEWLTRPDALSTQGPSSTEIVMAHTALERPVNGAYSDDMVDVSVEPRRGNPLPRYPAALRNMGIEGAFVVHFVVDSTGQVPDDRIDFPHSMPQPFADAVRAALHRSRYVPARIAGRPVTELVVQEFRFEMRKR